MASAACMNEQAMPRLFIVATIFRPTRPLLPTPHMMSFPPASLTCVMTSTLRTSPSCAAASVSYSNVTCDNAVAAVDKTFTARETRRAPSESVAVRGGVSGCASTSECLRFWHVDVDGGESAGVCNAAAILKRLAGSREEYTRARTSSATTL